MARPPTGQVLELERDRGRVYAIRFRALGRRQYRTLGSTADGWTRARAEQELADTLALVRMGLWKPPEAPATAEPDEEPTFHVAASMWVERRRPEVKPRTVEFWQWALSTHLLPVFKDHRPSEITPALVDRYKAAKLQDGDLSARSVNQTLKVLAQVLDDAVDYGHVPTNVARGKKRRLKTEKPRRTWLELDEVTSIIDGAGKTNRALIATMILAGLRVGELCALRWRSVVLASGKLYVGDAKTDAGRREVELSPWLQEELTTHKASSRFTEPDDFVFATRNGTERKRSNVSRQILARAVVAADKARVAAGREPIREKVTNHSLRRTFASLLYEVGASPAYVMAQMGHTSSALALEVYARKMERSRDTGARMDALIRGADWALSGTTADLATDAAADGVPA
jgi:integrase